MTHRSVRALTSGLPVALLAPLVLAACGGSSPTVASLGGATTTTVAATPAAASPGRAQPEKFSMCMRAHGVGNFPDPVVNGNQISIRINPSITGNPHFAAAQQACSYLLPKLGKGTQTITAAQQQDYLKAAQCMRAHGITNFPDPVFPGGQVNFPIPRSMDTNSPAFNSARQVCQNLIPAGLPYHGG